MIARDWVIAKARTCRDRKGKPRGGAEKKGLPRIYADERGSF
jgi:hypothetical protein